jgi:CheY-like chemotaxis protein
MDWTETPRELRRTMRVRSKGSVRIREGARLIRGRILDIGVGGISVRAEVPIGFASPVRMPVRVDVSLDACSKRFSLTGHVLRSRAATNVIAIEFDELPSGFEDFVQDELLAAVEHDALPRMILVDTVAKRRGVFANAFRGAGCSVTEVSTPLEAIAQLGQLRFEPGVIAVADSVPESIAADLREFLCEHHPEAHMVAISGSSRTRDPGESWLSWADTRDDLALRVGRVITAHSTRRRSMKSLPLASTGTRARHEDTRSPRAT